MREVNSKVRVPEVLVKLHWPSSGCPECAGECIQTAHELYRCESCGLVNGGLTKTVTGTVIYATD